MSSVSTLEPNSRAVVAASTVTPISLLVPPQSGLSTYSLIASQSHTDSQLFQSTRCRSRWIHMYPRQVRDLGLQEGSQPCQRSMSARMNRLISRLLTTFSDILRFHMDTIFRFDLSFFSRRYYDNMTHGYIGMYVLVDRYTSAWNTCNKARDSLIGTPYRVLLTIPGSSSQ